MTLKLLYLHCALVVFVMFSCNKSGTTDKNTSIIDSLEISSKYIQPVDSIHFLQSYNLSCSYPCGDSLAIMGYNYRTHALDIFQTLRF